MRARYLRSVFRLRIPGSAFLTALSLLGFGAAILSACSDRGGGGIPGSGGASASGGATGIGGSPGTGGVAAVGGANSGTGGVQAGSGGSSSGGGPSGSGGTDTGSGGTDGSGGSTPIIEPDFVTSAPNAYWQVGELTPASGGATITVNDTQVLGEWRGFGGTFNEKGWEAMKALSQEDRDLAMHLLFDRADGLAFTHGRIPIGSSDYALSRYSLNESDGDVEMNDFSIQRDTMDLIPYIHAALAIRPDLHFWASPWSPPTWMKDNGQFDQGWMIENDDMFEAHALYLAKFVEAYEEEGIYVEAIHPQNEPGYRQDYPSCGWTPGGFTEYIRDFLGPLFAERLPDREIWVGTMSNPTEDKAIVDAVMTDSGAAAYISGIGVQWSQDQHVPGYISNYQKPVMQTEHRCGNFPNPQQTNIDHAPNDDAYARESWGYIAHYIRQGASAYMAWNMVLDTTGRNLDTVRPWAQNALLAVDVNAGELIVTPTYYVFRHVAQYVDPGSVRVDVDGGDAVAWKNPDGDIVLVLHNDGGSPEQSIVSVGGSTYQITVPGQGWATVNWQAP